MSTQQALVRVDETAAVAPAYDDFEMTGRLKAAVMLLALPEERAIEVLKRLDHEQVEQLAVEVANLNFVPEDVIVGVFEEFKQHISTFRFVAGGGVRKIQDLVNRALPADEADKINARVLSDHQPPPFRALAAAPINQAVDFLRNEHPQTIALVLAHVRQDLAAQIMAELEEERLCDVALRLLQIETTPPDVIQTLDEQIRIRMAPSEDDLMRDVGIDGLKRLVDILNCSPRAVEQRVLEHLETYDDDLYQQVRKAMFVFEDLISLDNRSVQRLLREVDSNDLALSLKGAREDLRQLFFRNMSERAGLILREDMQFMGPVRASDVYEAQQRIINAARNLEQAGEIVIPRSNSEAMID